MRVSACSGDSANHFLTGVVATQAMADVFALQRIHADVLFRNDDYVAAEKAKAIGRLLEHLRRELREVAVPLVDAWNIPVTARSVLMHLLAT